MEPRIIHLSHVEIQIRRTVRTGPLTYKTIDDTMRGIVQSVDEWYGTASVYWQDGKYRTHRLKDLNLVRQ